MTDEKFCQLYDDFYGEHGWDSMSTPSQLSVRMDGYELKELIEYFLNDFRANVSIEDYSWDKGKDYIKGE
jgi:hypothetical protein